MTVAALTDLRGPPVVGNYYMVPTVRYRLRGMTLDWPVLGPRHHDAQDLNFPHLHYHFDYRFMSDRMLHSLSNAFGGYFDDMLMAGTPLSEPRGIESLDHLQEMYGRLPKEPTVKRRLCRRLAGTYPELAREKILSGTGEDRIAKRLGNPASAKVINGRRYCPHRMVDLTSFTADENGIVTCPLHGLRVQCGGAS